MASRAASTVAMQPIHLFSTTFTVGVFWSTLFRIQIEIADCKRSSPVQLNDLWDLAEACDNDTAHAQQELRHCVPLFSFHQCRFLLT